VNSDTRIQAQDIVRRLCVGRSICGVHFYADQPIVVLGSYDGSSTVAFEGPSQALLMIEAGWTVSENLSSDLAATDVAIPPRTIEELAVLASSLRRFPITSVHLGDPAPHLGLRFADGRALFVNGWDPRFEVWSINAGAWSIYALQNAEIDWGSDHPAFL
jgi:hypothetical protein